MARRVDLFNLLNGLVAVYKPPNLSANRFSRLLKTKLANEFNGLPSEPKLMRTILRPPLVGSHDGKHRSVPIVVSVPDIVDNTLVLGRKFFPGDFMLHPIDALDEFTSGIQVFGIGCEGVAELATTFSRACWLKTYLITGMLGRASSDGTASGSTLLRTSWRHVTRPKLDRLLSALQVQFKKMTLLHAGIRPNTQQAYLSLAQRSSSLDLRPISPSTVDTELDDREQVLSPWDRHPSRDLAGFFNPAGEKPRLDEPDRRQQAPYVNSLECVHFEPPFFTIEAQVAHETTKFLIDLIANLGPKLRSSTLLTSARRVRHGLLTLEDALLLKHCLIPPTLLNALSAHVEYEGHADYSIDWDDEQQCAQLLSHLASVGHGQNSVYPHLFTNLHTCSIKHPHSDASDSLQRQIPPVHSPP